jgi:hypothetical protein
MRADDVAGNICQALAGGLHEVVERGAECRAIDSFPFSAELEPFVPEPG